MSDKLSRPFFFNTKTGLGSFTVPKEIAEATDHSEVGAMNASKEDVCISLCDSENSGKRKRSTSIDIVLPEGLDDDLNHIEKLNSTEESFEKSNTIKIDDPGRAAGVRNLYFVSEGEASAVMNSVHHSKHTVSDIKKLQDSSTIEILDDDDDDGGVEKDADLSHAPDLIKSYDHHAFNINYPDKCDVIESVYQSTDSTQLDIHQSNRNHTIGSSSSRSSDGVLMDSNLLSWSCAHCTFENMSPVFSCNMCGMPSGRQRRSQRDSQNTIMQGFALTQSQQNNLSTDAGTSSSSRHCSNLTQNLLSTSSSVANYGEAATPVNLKQNSRRK